MSVQVNNTDNQLSIITNGVLDVYAVKTIKSVSRGVDASGNSYIIINFIANDKNNSLRINLSEVTSPVTWTNDAAGAATAVSDIRGWLSEVIEVEINEANDSILIYGFDGVDNQPISVTPTGEVNIRPLDCGDEVSLCFNDGVSDVTVSSTNPLPVNAVLTVPSALDTALFAFDITSGVNEALTTTETSPGTHALDVNITTLGLDIRPLTCATDSIKICEGGNDLGVGADGSIAVNLIDSVNGTQAVVNSDGTQNNAIYGFDHTSLQNERITSVGLSATVQALDVNIANSVPTLDVAIVSPLGVLGNCDNAVSAALCQAQEDILSNIETNTGAIYITPNIQISSGDAATAIGVAVYSVTFFNNGSVDVLVSFTGGGVGTYVTIPAGTSIAMDAGGINNQYQANTFYYDTFTANPLGSLIVTYNS